MLLVKGMFPFFFVMLVKRDTNRQQEQEDVYEAKIHKRVFGRIYSVFVGNINIQDPKGTETNGNQVGKHKVNHSEGDPCLFPVTIGITNSTREKKGKNRTNRFVKRSDDQRELKTSNLCAFVFVIDRKTQLLLSETSFRFFFESSVHRFPLINLFFISPPFAARGGASGREHKKEREAQKKGTQLRTDDKQQATSRRMGRVPALRSNAKRKQENPSPCFIHRKETLGWRCVVSFTRVLREVVKRFLPLLFRRAFHFFWEEDRLCI